MYTPVLYVISCYLISVTYTKAYQIRNLRMHLHAHPEDSHTISENPTSDSLLLKSFSKEFQQCASYETLII